MNLKMGCVINNVVKETKQMGVTGKAPEPGVR